MKRMLAGNAYYDDFYYRRGEIEVIDATVPALKL